MIKRMWKILMSLGILVVLTSTPIMAAQIVGQESDDEHDEGVHVEIDTTTENDFVDQTQATVKDKIKTEIEKQMKNIGESAQANLEMKVFDDQNKVKTSIKDTWLQSTNFDLEEELLENIYEKHAEHTTKKGEEKIDAWVNNYYENNVDLITDKVYEYIDGQENKIGEGVSIILYSATENISNEVKTYVTETENMLPNVITETTKKYSTQITGWDRKAAEAVMVEANIKIDDIAQEKLLEEFAWESKALNSAFKEVDSFVSDVADDFSDQAMDYLKGYMGYSTDIDIAQVIEDYMMREIMGCINNPYDKISDIISQQALTKEQKEAIGAELNKTYKEIEDAVKIDVKKEATEFYEGFKKAVDAKFSGLGKEVAGHLSNIAGEIAASYAMTYYSELHQKIEELTENLGALGESVVQVISYNIGGWLQENIARNISTLIMNTFFNGNGKFGITELNIDWKNLAAQVLLSWLSTNEKIGEVLEIFIEGYGGITSGYYPFETYVSRNYNFIMKGGTLIPAISFASANTTALVGAAASLGRGDVGAFGQLEAGAGYHALQFTPAGDTQTICNFYGVWLDGKFAKPIPPTPLMSRPGIIALENRSNTEPRWWPSGSSVVSVSDPRYADTEYIVNEMMNNTGGDSYVQRAFSLSTLSLKYGNPFTPSMLSKELWTEAQKYRLFRTECTAKAGFYNAIKDTTKDAKSRYMEDVGAFVLGPFKVDYIKSTIQEPHRDKVHFGFMCDMDVYYTDANGNEQRLQEGSWMILFEEDGEMDFSSERYLDDYSLPYPNEEFYILVSQDMNTEVTSISKIEMKFREMVTVLKGQKLNMQHTQIRNVNLPSIIVPMGIHHPPKYIWTMKRIPIEQIRTNVGFSVLFTSKQYVRYTYEIKLAKKQTGIPAYDTQDFVTAGSLITSDIEVEDVVYGNEINSSLYNSLSTMIKNNTSEDRTDYNSSGSTFTESAGTISNIYTSADGDTKYIQALNSILKAIAENDATKSLSTFTNIVSTPDEDFSRVAKIAQYVSEREKVRELATVMDTGVEIYKNTNNDVGMEILKLLNEVSIIYENDDFAKVMDSINQTINNCDYKAPVFALLSQIEEIDLTNEVMDNYLQKRYPELNEDNRSLVMSVAKSIESILSNTGNIGNTIKNIIIKAYKLYEGTSTISELIQAIVDNSEDQELKNEYRTFINLVQINKKITEINADETLSSAEKYRYIQEEQIKLFEATSIAAKELNNGETIVDAIEKAYGETSNIEQEVFTKFQTLIKDLQPDEIISLTQAIIKSKDIKNTLDIVNSEVIRNNLKGESEKATTFSDILEQNASLYDRTSYTEFNNHYNITKVERPGDVYYMGDDKIDLTMTIAGVVWKDGHSGLQNDYDGIRTTNTNGDMETGIEGVRVRLRRVDNEKIGRMRVNNKWVEAVTYTDEGGYYHFEEVESAKYYVEFTYDGHKYMPTTTLSDGQRQGIANDYKHKPDLEMYDNNSKAKEIERERVEFNDKFYSIENGVAYDKEGKQLSVDGKTVGLEYEEKDGVSKLITLDNSGYVLPQFAMTASTKQLGITYPIDTSVTLDNETTSSFTSAYGQSEVVTNEYIKTGEYMYHVNLGLVERTKLDLATTQDVYEVTTTVNEKQEVYAYNQRGGLSVFDAKLKQTEAYTGISYTRELYNADYQLRLDDYKLNTLNKLDRNGNDKTNEIEKIKEVKELQYTKGGLEERVFITYKMTLKNQSLLQSAKINELTDYFDSTYKLVTEDTYQDIQNAEGIVENKLVAKQSYFIVQADNKAEEHKLIWEEIGMTNGLKTMRTVQTDQIGLEDVILSAQDEIYVFVTFELEKDANRALQLGKKENVVEISSYTSLEIGATDFEHSIGLIDKDSAPDNITVGGVDTYEDDTDAAPVIEFKLYSTDLRNVNGYVWNDDRNVKLSTGQIVGNGVRETKEELINGVRVQLVEIVRDPLTGAEYEYVWKEMFTGEDNYKHIGSSGSITNTERGQTVSTGSIISNTNLGAVQKGEYKFHNYIAGNFIIRYIYGDTYKTYLTAGSENAEGEGLNEASFNGHDYKSTAYLKGNNLYAEWYDLSGFDKEDKLYSDAKDDTARRNVVIDYASTIQNDKAEILASFDDRDEKYYYNRQLHQALRNNTWMFADTAKINVNIEYNTTKSNGLQNLNYKIKNMDFGLEKRPETKLELTKEITDIKITLPSGEVIINTAAGMSQNVNWPRNQKTAIINNGKKTNYNKRDSLRYEYRQGNAHIYMDEEVMQGTNIQFTFKITVTNNSEIDYTGQNGNLGYTYFTGQVSTSDKIVTTTVNKIIDYVDNSLTFRKVDSPDWSLIETMREFTTTGTGTQIEIEIMDYGTYIETMMQKYGEDYVADHLREFEAQYQKYKQTGTLEDVGNNGNKKDEEDEKGVGLANYNVIKNMKDRTNSIGYLHEDLSIVKTKSAKVTQEPITQVIVTKALENTALKPGQSASVDLILSKTLSPNDEDDTLNYGNMAEILQYSNSVGRRDMDAIPGNQEPDEEPYEYDTEFTERILITPPYGENKAFYFVLSIAVLAILTGGIILIKKKVFNN